MIMDYVRSFYTSNMIFRTGDPPVLVTWKPAAPDAIPFPFPHNFGSSNWNERNYQAGDIGEQDIVTPWIEPMPSDRSGRICACPVPVSWWTSGIPTGQQTPITDANGVPLCCSGPVPVIVNGYTIPDMLTLSFDGSVCPQLSGVVAVLNRLPGQGAWVGNAVINFGLGNIAIVLRIAGPQPNACSLSGAWTTTFGNFNTQVIGADTSSCPPPNFKFPNFAHGMLFSCAGSDCTVGL